MTSGSRRRRHWLIVAAISIALHAGVLVWSFLLPERPPRQGGRPVEITIARRPPAVAPVSPESARAPLPPARPSPGLATRSGAKRPSATARKPGDPSAEGASPEPATQPGPRRDRATAEAEPPAGVDLFPRGAVETGARWGHGSPDDSGTTSSPGPDAAAAGRELAEEKAALRRAATGDYSPAVRALGERLVQWFTPPPRLLDQGTALGLGPASSLQAYSKFLREVASRSTTPDQSPTLAPDQVPGVPGTHSLAGATRTPIASLCFGACYGGAHEVTSMAAIVHIDHADTGLPTARRVVASSGSREFDAEALSAVDATLRFTSPDRLAQPHPPRWSRWEFSAHVYRWRRDELMWDPAWTPPGKTVREDALGRTTMTEEIRLVAINYDPVAGVAPAGPAAAPGR